MVERLTTAIEKARQTRSLSERASPPGRTANLPASTSLDWSDLRRLEVDSKTLERARVEASSAQHPGSNAFELMQVRLLRLMREQDWKRIAITASSRGCGATTVALNLALGMSQRAGLRVLLCDFDLRSPSLARVLDPSGTASRAAAKDRGAEPSVFRVGESLAVLANVATLPEVVDSFGEPPLIDIIDRLQRDLRPDLVLLDLPPIVSNSSLLSVLGEVDAALLVAAANASTASEIDASARLIDEATSYLGVVLNKGRVRRQERVVNEPA